MTPLEELQAAQERLSELRNSTGGNAWKVGRCDPGEGWFYVENADTGEDELYTERGTNIDLIVTLHRTIDVQLAILSTAIDEVGYSGSNLTVDQFGRCDEPNACYEALALARAINGEA